MDFAANFTAIDFETANRRRDSACQLAAVRVRDGQITDKKMWMIRPRPLSFSPSNIQIHGITAAQVRDESEFGDLWEEVANAFDDDCLVAHNASFDIGVLLACLQTHRKTIPEFHFTCTRAIARRTWPHLRRYGLKPLSDWLGVRFQHHDALEDSIACAKILLAAGIDKQAASIEELEKKLRLSRGKAGQWGYKGAITSRSNATRSRRSHHSRKPPSDTVCDSRRMLASCVLPTNPTGDANNEAIDLQRLMIRADFIRALDGKQVVFSGRFKNFNLDQVRRLAVRLGGICQDEVSEETDLVVFGELTGPPPPAPATARIMSESGFLGFLVAETE